MARRRGATFQNRHRAKKPEGRFLLPGVGDGLVDPDFDSLREAELDVVEGVRGHGWSEDNDQS